MCNQQTYVFEEARKSIQHGIGYMYCPTCRNFKYVQVSAKRTSSFFDCKKCTASYHVLNFPFKDQESTLTFFVGVSTFCFAKRTSRDYGMEKPYLF